MDGIIIINKPRNYTSRDIVNIIGKKFNTKKVGHTGTLDPIAEGVLIITLNKCTKLSDILTSETKKYIATLKFGELTDTLDITGNVIKTSDKIPTKEEILNCLKTFPKEYDQEVPIYSAVKVNGKKLYEYARNNETITLPIRKVKIYNLELIKYTKEEVTIETTVSKGTYIRSLIRDLAEKLGTYATMTNLIRTKQGKFTIEESYTLEQIQNDDYKIIDLEEIFKDYPVIKINKDDITKIQNGQMFNNTYNSKFILFKYQNTLLAVYKINEKDQTKIKPLILV